LEVTVHQGRYVRWDPYPGITGRWYLDALHHDWEGFRLLLRSADSTVPVLRLTFEVPLLFQVAEEGFRLSGADEDSELAFPHPFYTVERSSLVAEFHRSSCGVYRDWAIRHFAIYAADECVDVLSVQEPRADMLGSGSLAELGAAHVTTDAQPRLGDDGR
jgi:hypothetical protein